MKDIGKNIPLIPFFQQKEETSEQLIQQYTELFDLITLYYPNLIQSEKEQILKKLLDYHQHNQEESESLSESDNSNSFTSSLISLKGLLLKLKIEMSYLFLYSQFKYLSDTEERNSIFKEYIGFLKEFDKSICFVTKINKSHLYSTTQNEYASKFIECLRKSENDILEKKKESEPLLSIDDKLDALRQFQDYFFDFIIDLLYRRIPLTSLFQQVQSKCIQSELGYFIEKLNVNDELQIVFKQLRLQDKISLGQILSASFISIPVFYPIKIYQQTNTVYHNNIISAFYPLYESFDKHLLMNLCTENIEQKQRGGLFSYLTNNKEIITDLQRGINSQGSFNFYSTFPNCKLNDMVMIDIAQANIRCELFRQILTEFIDFSSILFLHINCEKDMNICMQGAIPSLELKRIIKEICNNQNHCQISVYFIFHNFQQKHQKYIEHYLELEIKNVIQNFSPIFIKENKQEYVYSEILEKYIHQEQNERLAQLRKEKFEQFFSKQLNFENFQKDDDILQFQEKVRSQISNALKLKQYSSNESYKLLNDMFQFSNAYSQYYYKEKIFQNFSRQYFKENDPQEKYMKKGEKLIQLKKKFSQITELHQLTIFFFDEITSNNQIKATFCQRILSEWKLPLVDENNKNIDIINEGIRDLERRTKIDPLNQEIIKKLDDLYKQKNQFIILHDNYDISNDSFIRELSLYLENYQKNHSMQELKNLYQYELKIKNYYRNSFDKGIPIQFIDKTRKFGSRVLEDFFKSIDSELGLQNYKIVSVVGPQSSAKSTLMNYLFRCRFETSSARCTKGMYFTKINFEDTNLIVVDTEGLLSNVFRDQSFDNSVMALLFLISHVIIFNIKDEANSKMKDMTAITEEVMKIFSNDNDDNFKIPETFVALRDYMERTNIDQKKKQIINEMIQVRGIFESTDLSARSQNSIKLKPENIFIFPSAFSEIKQYDARYQQINTGFGEDILIFRRAITQKLNQIHGYRTFQDFYSRAERIWNRLMEFGHDLLKCVSVQEFESKKKLEEIATKQLKDLQIKNQNKIIEKENELKLTIEKELSSENILNRIKKEYNDFVRQLNDQINNELENDLLELYKTDKQINSISTKEFYFIVNQVQYHNRIFLESKQYVYDNRITHIFFNKQIAQIKNDFNKDVQKQVGEKKFEENQQSLQNILKDVEDTYTKKIHSLQKKFGSVDEIMRSYLVQLKSEAHYHSPQQKELINELSSEQIVQDIEQNSLMTQLPKKTINSHESLVKLIFKDYHKLDNNFISVTTNYTCKYFQSILVIQKVTLTEGCNNNPLDGILNQTISLYNEYLKAMEDEFVYRGSNNIEKHLNKIKIQKSIFQILYQKASSQKKEKQKKMLGTYFEKLSQSIKSKLYEISQSSKAQMNWEDHGINAMKRIQKRIIDTFIDMSKADMETDINYKVENIITDHKIALDNAFQSVYERSTNFIHIDNFLKYVTDINRYIDEMKKDQIKIIAQEQIDQKSKHFEILLKQILHNLNSSILAFKKENDFKFEDIIEKLNSIDFNHESLNLGQEVIIEDIKSAQRYVTEEYEIEETEFIEDDFEEKKVEFNGGEEDNCNMMSSENNNHLEEGRKKGQQEDQKVENNEGNKQPQLLPENGINDKKDQIDHQAQNSGQEQKSQLIDDKIKEESQSKEEDKIECILEESEKMNENEQKDEELIQIDSDKILSTQEKEREIENQDDQIISNFEAQKKENQEQVEAEKNQQDNQQVENDNINNQDKEHINHNDNKLNHDDEKKDQNIDQQQNEALKQEDKVVHEGQEQHDKDQSPPQQGSAIKVNQKKKYIQIPVEKIYLNGMLSVLAQSQSEIINQMLEQFLEELNSSFEISLQNHYSKMIGCQKRCPFCGQKCFLEHGHIEDHNVFDRHILLGFYGYSKKGIYVTKFCSETINEPFSINFKEYENMSEASKQLYQKWTSCFDPEKEIQKDEQYNYIIKKGFSLTYKYIEHLNNISSLRKIKAELSEEFQNMIGDQQQIDSTYKIQWKYENGSGSVSSDDQDDENEEKSEVDVLLRLLELLNKLVSD